VNRFAKEYTELDVYQESVAVAKRIYELTRRFPREERYALTDQLRRASWSIGAAIAEAWSKRHYPRHFKAKLTDADAEQMETRHWVTVAATCGYISQQEADALVRQLGKVGRQLNIMIGRARQFRV
jgi:four helix bundle protein